MNLLRTATMQISECLSYPGFNVLIGNLFADDVAATFRGFTNRPSTQSSNKVSPVAINNEATKNDAELAVEVDISVRDGGVFSFSNGSIDAPSLTGGRKVEWLNSTLTSLVNNDTELRTLLDNVGSAMMSAYLFQEQEILDIDLFAVGVYADQNELLRCQQPFVRDLGTWSTTSQSVVVVANDNTVYFAERATQPTLSEWRVFQLKGSTVVQLQ